MSKIEKKGFHKKKWQELSLGVKILIIVGGTLVAIGLMVLFGFIVMWLWNWLMPKLFNLPSISYWEGWGVVILSWILFHSKHGSKSFNERRRKHKLHERMETLEDEKNPLKPAGGE